ncbi:Type IIB DNA topoisomerase [Gracilaria domingensis]|nr:Type IIB DNA topoisomerase [Gracilaria domingensis]
MSDPHPCRSFGDRETNKVSELVQNLRERFPNPDLKEGSWRASVAMVFRPSRSDSIHVPLDLLFIQRAPREGDPWSAHIAFPGGRRDPEDKDDLSTALRETKEEIGADLNTSAYEFISRIQDRPIIRGGQKRGVLSAFVFLQKEPCTPSMVLDHAEIASAFWVPLSHLHRWSPNIANHSMPLPDIRTISLSQVAGSIMQRFGFTLYKVRALNVLPHAVDVVKVPDVHAPHVVLWGMSLDCLGDVLDSFGIPRVDRPHIDPPFRFMAAVASGAWDIIFHIKSVCRRLRNETAVMKGKSSASKRFTKTRIMGVAHPSASEVIGNLELITLNALRHVLLGEKRDQGNEHEEISPLVRQKPMIALRISYLAFLAHSSIRCGKVITKRDVFYMCRSLFPTPESVDRCLSHLSSALDIHRNQLNIVAVPKGLVVGRVTFVDEFENAIDVGMFGNTGCLIPSRPERLKNIVSDAHAIIVVEKEASFHSLIDESCDQGPLSRFLVVTGKGMSQTMRCKMKHFGYPDIGTRLFLRTVAEAHEGYRGPMPIYIVTDADPHGLNIANCYIDSLRGCAIQWLGVRHSDQGKMFMLQDVHILHLNDSENVLLDGMLSRWDRDTDTAKVIKQCLIQEAKNMKASQTKFEMEAVVANRGFYLQSHQVNEIELMSSSGMSVRLSLWKA